MFGETSELCLCAFQPTAELEIAVIFLRQEIGDGPLDHAVTVIGKLHVRNHLGLHHEAAAPDAVLVAERLDRDDFFSRGNFAAVFAVFGWNRFRELPIEAFPDVTFLSANRWDVAGALAPEARRARELVYVPNSQSNTVDVIDPRTYQADLAKTEAAVNQAKARVEAALREQLAQTAQHGRGARMAATGQRGWSRVRTRAWLVGPISANTSAMASHITVSLRIEPHSGGRQPDSTRCTCHESPSIPAMASSSSAKLQSAKLSVLPDAFWICCRM